MISIIIPMYNVEKYIETTITSIKEQTYDNYEVILIDDGSTDNTLEVAKKIVGNDVRYKIFTQENKGVSATRNRGLELANGEYIYFLDGDDVIDKNLLQDAIEIFRKNLDIDIFSFGVIIKKRDGRIKDCSNLKYDNLKLSSMIFLKKFLNDEIKQSICSVIYKKALIEKYKFNTKLSIGEDLLFQIKVLLENDIKVYYSSRIYFYYLIRDNSTTTDKNINLKHLNLLSYFDELIEEMNKRNINEYNKFYIQIFFSMLYGFLDKNPSKTELEMIKKEYEKYERIIKKIKFKITTREIYIYIQKLMYCINIKYFYYFTKFSIFSYTKISKILNKKGK